MHSHLWNSSGGKLLVLDLAYHRWLKPKNDAIFEAAKALKLKELFDAHSNSMKYVLVCMYIYSTTSIKAVFHFLISLIFVEAPKNYQN